MTSHTPGPWKLLHKTAHQHDGDRAIYGPDNKLICEMNGGPNDNSEILANARLIASAPELLLIAKAYINLLRTMADTDGLVETFHHIKNLIEKVEGRI